MTPGTHRILARCCRCGGELVLEAAADCPPDVIDAMARMTTCDRCAGPERKPRRKRAEAGQSYRPPHKND